MSESTIACDEELWLTNDSAVLTKVANLISVSPPSLSISEVDQTTQESGCVEEMRAGLITLGSVEAELNHIPNSATDQLLREHAASKETRAAKVVIRNAAGAQIEETFTAFITEYNPGGGTAPGDKRTSTVTLKPTILSTVAAV